MMQTQKPHHILAIEDNAAESNLLSLLFKDSGTPIQLHVACDGVEATDFLMQRGEFKDSPRPDLVLMDVNIPRKDGPALLKEMRTTSTLCNIPVIFLSTATSDREVEAAYCNGVNAFISKPEDIDSYQEIINSLCAFWLRCVELPSRPRSALWQ